MNKQVLLSAVLCAGMMGGLSGCAKAVQCQAPDNSTVRISVLEDSKTPVIIRDRWNPFMEAVYSERIKINGNTVYAERSEVSKLHINTPFTNQTMKLDGSNDTVEIGEGKYTCGGTLMEVINLVKKVEKSEIDSRKRALGMDEIKLN